MSRSLNKVMLIGNVGNDPEIRATSGGARVAKLSLATNRSWSGRDGQQQEKTEWHRLTFFGRLVDIVEQWVHKGDRLYVEGRLDYSTVGEGDAKRYFTDIVIDEMVMLGSGTGAGGGGGGGGSGAGGGFSSGGYGGGGPAEPSPSEPDDDLPF
ncbi:MAG TPA: single-stranded DNA-binding protein [Longimicrobiales bacterium]|nr:single-stranded DNA-binding protein [Longimicrobiales bacterium]